jgi:hypothetical protein
MKIMSFFNPNEKKKDWKRRRVKRRSQEKTMKDEHKLQRISPLLGSSYFPTSAPTSSSPTLVPTTVAPSATLSPTTKLTQSVNKFFATSQDIEVAVPSNVHEIYLYMWGAGGGCETSPGGSGAYVEGPLSVIPEEVLRIIVGRGGMKSDEGGYGQSSGGGRTAVQRNDEDIVTAGGGGGGGGDSGSDSGSNPLSILFGGSATSYDHNQLRTTSFQGGKGEEMTTECSIPRTTAEGEQQMIISGGGGNQTSGGCGGRGTTGLKYRGGSATRELNENDVSSSSFCRNRRSGGGGGGYYGGGAGYCGGAGGGGSSYLAQLSGGSFQMSESGKPNNSGNGGCSGLYSVYWNSSACGGGCTPETGTGRGGDGFLVMELVFDPTVSPTPIPSLVPSTSLPSFQPTLITNNNNKNHNNSLSGQPIDSSGSSSSSSMTMIVGIIIVVFLVLLGMVWCIRTFLCLPEPTLLQESRDTLRRMSAIIGRKLGFDGRPRPEYQTVSVIDDDDEENFDDYEEEEQERRKRGKSVLLTRTRKQ